MGTITERGAWWGRDPRSGNAGSAWGYGETLKPAGKRQKEASEGARGEPNKVAATSQAALGEARQSFAGAKTT